MGTKLRHFKALTKKNWINWKRTPWGNLIEFIVPILLFTLLWQTGVYIPSEVMMPNDLMQARHGLYPVVKEQGGGKEYKVSLDSLVEQIDDLDGFMTGGGVTAGGMGGYVPMADQIGPIFFFPYHCTKLERRNIYASPVIATIKQSNPINDKMVRQVLSHFEGMATLMKTVEKNDFLKSMIGKGLDKLKKNKQVLEAEQLLKLASAKIYKWSGQDRSISDFQFPNMGFTHKEFNSQAELDAYISHPDHGYDEINRPGICFALTMHENAPNDYELELFFNDAVVLDYRSIPPQDENSVNDSDMMPAFRQYFMYSLYGFAYMQNWAANTLLRHKTGVKEAGIVAMTVPFRLPVTPFDGFTGLMYFILHWCIMVMYIPLLYRVTYRIVKEKELRTKEIMRMMGMKTSSYWLSWFAYYTVINTLVSTAAWVVLHYGCMRYTQGIVTWFVLWAYGQTLFGYIMLCQSFFTQAKIASVLTTTIYFGSGLMLNLPEYAPFWKRVAVSVFPTGCMYNTIKVITGFELNGMGIDYNSIHRDYRNYSVKTGLTTLLIGFWAMNMLGVYFEAVIPVQGRREPCCFCFSRKYWSGKNYDKKHVQAEDFTPEEILEEITQFETEFLDEKAYEPFGPWVALHEQSKRFLKIGGLVKQYSNGMRAVDGINIKMFADQIFVLLGHNGAGKSSLISTLTGLYEPTEGEAEVFGVDMFKNVGKLRQFMGICPQHDILFDLLTVEEHLEIFYDFKEPKPTPKKKKAEVDKLVKDAGLDDRKKYLACKLSGGNQRKLSVALSLVGGSKLIIMDEPTSSLDLSARRKVWNLLKEYKKDRIIVLTTHYMDEADILGDRIGIMSRGKISALGSSLFLKRQFGVGYNLTLVKSTTEHNKEVVPYCLRHLGKEVKLVSQYEKEIRLSIPANYATKFKEFFEGFDAVHKSDLKIDSYGITITTLEDVFLSVGHQVEEQERKKNRKKLRNIQDQFNLMTPQNSRKHSKSTGGHSPRSMSNQSPRSRAYTAKTVAGVKHLKGRGSPRSTNRSIVPEDLHSIEDVGESELEEIPSSDVDGRSITPIGNPRRETREGKTRTTSKAGKRGDRNEEEQQEIRYQGRTYSLMDSNNKMVHGDNLVDLSNNVDQNGTDNYSGTDDSPGGEVNDEEDDYEHFNLAQLKEDAPWCGQFYAVFLKRVQLYQGWRVVAYELLIPILIMVIGIGMTKIEFFTRSPSKLLDPSRLVNETQILLFNRDIPMQEPNSSITAYDFADGLTNRKEYYDIRYTNTSKTFDEFYDYIDDYGKAHCPSFPFFYGAYQFYQADRDQQKYKFYSFMNSTCADCPVLFPQFMYDSILKVATKDPNFSFKTRNTPFPITNAVRKRKVEGITMIVIFMTAIAYSMLITSIVGHVVHERVCGHKHMQLISGLRMSAYWTGNFLVDLIKMEVVVSFTCATFWFCEMDYPTAWTIFTVFPVAIIPLTYVISFLFDSVQSAQTAIMALNFGVMVFGTTFVHMSRWIKFWEVEADTIHKFLRSQPAYTLGQSIYFDATQIDLVEFRAASSGKGADLAEEPFILENVGGDLIALGVHFVFWSAVLMCIEAGCGKKVARCRNSCYKTKYPRPEFDLELDEQVLEEERRVSRMKDHRLQVKVNNLRKIYMTGAGCTDPGIPLRAVEKLSFGLSKGECFALLGVNGAGKSTTFKTMVAQEEPTMGKVTVQGYDIVKDFPKARKLLGYCPQFNPVYETLTVDQNLYFFARIKGIPEDLQEELVDEAVQKLALDIHRQKLAGDLSGGNKRKLSVAIALLGNPPIILLDEPSAGMDPEARRFMWNVVKKITMQKTSAVVLTSHLMEEAEFLSTKMGIMVKGGIFKCFGTAQFIKNKFGVGYECEIKICVPPIDELIQLAEDEVSKCFVQQSDGFEVFQSNSKKSRKKQKRDKKRSQRQVYIKSALQLLISQKRLTKVDAEMIRQELLTTYRHCKQPELNIRALEKELVLDSDMDEFSDPEEIGDVCFDAKCSAIVFAEKLFVQRKNHNVIKSICKVFGSLEVLEQYGNFMRLRVHKQDKTIGQVFGMIEEIKQANCIDQYSVSQTTLEQIFQGFANIQFEENIKTFSLNEADQIKIVDPIVPTSQTNDKCQIAPKIEEDEDEEESESNKDN